MISLGESRRSVILQEDERKKLHVLGEKEGTDDVWPM